jgi:flagellar biosynthesis anti-sigma factor FlgM
MIGGIRQNLTYMDPSTRKNGKAEAGATSLNRSPSVPMSDGASSELVQISSSALAGSNSAPIDKGRIEAIRDAIRRKEYPVDFEKLADRMIETDLGLTAGR